MEKFKEYLRSNQYAESTIKTTLQVLYHLEKWCKSELENLQYQELIQYIEKLQNQVQPQTINQRLQCIKLYFNYLIEIGEVSHNPARGVHVKNEKKRLRNLLSLEELEKIETNYNGNNHYKLMLSFIIHQATDSWALSRLKTEHIDLEKGTVYLTGSRRSNPRKLTLKTSQMLPLFKYLQTRNEELLFNPPIDDRLNYMMRKLKPKVENIRQIRSSVITNWLKTYNLREVQYFCGHRFISSTEKYQLANFEELKEEVGDCHPMN